MLSKIYITDQRKLAVGSPPGQRKVIMMSSLSILSHKKESDHFVIKLGALSLWNTVHSLHK